MNRWTRTIGLMALALLAGTAASDPPATAPSVDGHGGMVAATLITIHVKNASAQSVYAEIFRQAKLPLVPIPADLLTHSGLPRLSVDADGQPWLAVMEQLRKQSGLDLNRVGPNFELMKFMGTPGLTNIDGAIRLELSGLDYRHTVSFQNAPPTTTQMTLRIGLSFEPKVNVIQTGSQVRLDEALDDHGNSLLPPKPNHIEQEYFDIWQPMAFTDLRYPAKNPGTRIDRLRGTWMLTIATRVQHVEIGDVQTATNHAIHVDGQTVTFLACRKAADRSYHISLSFDSPPSTRRRLLFADAVGRMRLVDSAGVELVPVTDDRNHRNRDTASPRAYLVFDRQNLPDNRLPEEPVKLVWDSVIESRTVEVPFEFRNIDMRITRK